MHFIKPNLLASKSKRDEIKLRAAVRRASRCLNQRDGTRSHGLSCDINLDETARSRKGLLEQLKRIVIIQNLDGIGERGKLLGAILDILFIQFLLFIAVLIQISQKLLVLDETLTSITQIVLH